MPEAPAVGTTTDLAAASGDEGASQCSNAQFEEEAADSEAAAFLFASASCAAPPAVPEHPDGVERACGPREMDVLERREDEAPL
eukprot:1288739-Pyramimonas_sp.AAC.1